MPRMVYHDATGPQEVKPAQQSVWICMCGLSQDYPFCDGSHKKARQEDPAKMYVYDKDRQNVVEEKNAGGS